VRGDSGVTGVAGEGRVVGVPKFHSRGKCTMPLTYINSDCMDVQCFLWPVYINYIILRGPLFHILGCNNLLSTWVCITFLTFL